MRPRKETRQDRERRKRDAMAILQNLPLGPKVVAPLVGHSWRTVYRWKNGERVPGRAALEKLREIKKRGYRRAS